jgi:hypothetical protein
LSSQKTLVTANFSAGFLPPGGRVSLSSFAPTKKTFPSDPRLTRNLAKRLLIGLERNELQKEAGDETRTRDNLLGRQGLYQLSYSRVVMDD